MSEKKKEAIAKILVEKALVRAVAGLTAEDPVDDSLSRPYPNLGAFLTTSMPGEGRGKKKGAPEHASLSIRFDRVTTTWAVSLSVYARQVRCTVHVDQFDKALEVLDRALGMENPPWQSIAAYRNGK